MTSTTQIDGEQRPLLGHGKIQDNGTVETGHNPDIVEEENSNGKPIADEPSTKQLLLVMSGVWLGCILAGKAKERNPEILLIEP